LAADLDHGSGPGARVRAALTGLLVLALFALSTGPNLLEKISTGARQNTVSDVGPDVAAVRYLQVGLVLVVLGICCALLVHRPGPVRGVAYNPFVTSMLLLWAVLTVTDLAAGELPSVWSVLFPTLVLTLWVCRPPIESLVVVGVGGIAVAVVSMLLGAFVPGVGIYRNSAGLQVAADKGLVTDNLLAGVFTSTNNLGQMLCLALPFVFLLRSRLLRATGAAAVLVAIVWCGSRSSIAAVAVGLLALALGPRRRGSAAAWWAQVLLVLAACACAALPFVPFRDITFSRRETIWAVSTRYWQNDELFGLGSRWYADVSGLHTDFGPRSEFFLFHAHNQVLQFLVTGGLVCAALFLYAMYRLTRSLGRLHRTGRVAVAYLVSFWVSGSLEVNLGVVDRFQFYATALVPLVVLAVGTERANIDSITENCELAVKPPARVTLTPPGDRLTWANNVIDHRVGG
jgi:O-antigen ligase